jgi:hypothetical protein
MLRVHACTLKWRLPSPFCIRLLLLRLRCSLAISCFPLTARARLPFYRSFVAVNPHDLSYCSNERTQRPEVSVERDGEAGGLPLVAEFSTWNLYNENFVRIKTSKSTTFEMRRLLLQRLSAIAANRLSGTSYFLTCKPISFDARSTGSNSGPWTSALYRRYDEPFPRA